MKANQILAHLRIRVDVEKGVNAVPILELQQPLANRKLIAAVKSLTALSGLDGAQKARTDVVAGKLQVSPQLGARQIVVDPHVAPGVYADIERQPLFGLFGGYGSRRHFRLPDF